LAQAGARRFGREEIAFGASFSKFYAIYNATKSLFYPFNL
jgi:hypothetical protein